MAVKIEKSKDGKKLEVSFELPAPPEQKPLEGRARELVIYDVAKRLVPQYEQACYIPDVLDKLHPTPAAKQPNYGTVEYGLHNALVNYGKLTGNGKRHTDAEKKQALIDIAEEVIAILKGKERPGSEKPTAKKAAARKAPAKKPTARKGRVGGPPRRRGTSGF